MGRLVSREEAAEIAGVSVSTIRRLQAEKTLGSYEIPVDRRRVYVDVDELAKLQQPRPKGGD